MPQYLGRATIAYDGKVLDTMDGAKINLGGAQREARTTVSRVGYTEKLAPGMVECEIPLSADTPIEEIRNIVGATVTFRGDTGQTWVVRNAFVTDPLEITAGEGGKIPVKFAGEPAEEV